MSITIKKLEDIGDEDFLANFCELPFKVRKNEYSVGLYSPETTKKLMTWGHHHGSAFWLIFNGENVVMRVSARVCPQLEKTGTIGFFEIDETAKEYEKCFHSGLEHVLEWLRSQGIREVIAPVDLNTWFNYRFSDEGPHFFPRFSWEPTTPPLYKKLFSKAGFSDYAYFHTIIFPHFRIGNLCLGTGPMKRAYNRLHEKGFSLRPFNREAFTEKELPLFYEISQETFKSSLLFEAIDYPTFKGLYSEAMVRYDFSPSTVLVSPEGEDVGFIFAFFDGDYLIIKSIAIRDRFQGLRISSGMIYNAALMAFAKKKKGTVSALVRTGLASEKIEGSVKKTMWFTKKHEYSLLKKDIK